MEIGAAFGALERSPVQTKLTQRYRVAKSTADVAESKPKMLLPLANCVLVKQEPVECHGSPNDSTPELDGTPAASLLCRASNMFGGVVKFEHDPGEITIPGAVSLQGVKRELLSPSSCVTNDSVFHDTDVEGKTFTDVESLATAHANLMCRAAGTPSPRGKEPVAIGAPTTEEALQLPVQVASVASATSLMTALVMIPESATQPRSASCNGNATSVKREAVESKEKMITAMDMLGEGRPQIACPSSATTEAQFESRNAEIVRPVEPTPTKLMTAMLMFPPRKLEPHSEVDVRCSKKRPSVQTAYPPDAPTASKSALLRVKSEPLDNVREPALEESASLRKANSQNTRNAVKDELVHFAPATHQSGVFAHRNNEHQATSDSEHCSTGSEENCDIMPSSQRSQNRDAGSLDSSLKEIKPRKINPGRRVQGGRLYDSAFGKTCHWCRQKTVEPHVKCRECTIHYCGPCLLNRNGENIREELCEGVRWLCPKCRNGCGPGCDNCCNCGPCRKALGKPPTGQMVGVARNAGFENAHDYLVHLETGESPLAIAWRKAGRDWTNCGRFKCTTDESESGDDGASLSDGADEFTLNEETSTQLHQGKLDMKFVKRFVKSQKRKRVAMRAPLPAKRSNSIISHIEAATRRRVDSIRARLKLIEPERSKEKDNDASRRSATRNTNTNATRTESDASVRNQSSGKRITTACKSELVDFNDGINVTASDLEPSAGEQRRAFLNDYFFSSRPSLFSEVKCKLEPDIGGVEIAAANGVTPASSLTMFEHRAMECPGDPHGTEYRTKLKSALAQPFDAEELEVLEGCVRCRKPVQKLRQMRGRVVDVVTEAEGHSYLDHHQDFAAKLEAAQSPPEKLALLRGFFFWLQHSCMEGAFRPWPSAQTQPTSRHQSGDCIETEGPDCQVTAVVFRLDEGLDEEANRRLKRQFLKMVPNRQSLLPYPAKKKFVQQVKLKMRAQLPVPPAKNNYRVVLGLPAPALC